MKNSRIIIDTNLWISFLIGNGYEKLDKIVLDKKCRLVFSNELINEFLSVIKRPKFRKYFSIGDVEDLLETMQEFAELVSVRSKVEICRDIKDNFLLSLSKDSSADYLITGDKDLLDLKTFENTKIITITDFLEL